MASINWSNVTDFSQIPSQANVATNGAFWPGIFFMIFIILIIVLISFGFEIALLVSSFISIVIGIILVYSGLMNWSYLVIMISILLFLFMYIGWSGSRRSG